MRSYLLFVGSEFHYNDLLQHSILRNIKKYYPLIDTITFYSASDNSILLYLEAIMRQESDIFIVTSKKSFTLIGKLLSTITSDNQVLKDSMLLPSQSTLYEKNSYLLGYENAHINVLQIDNLYDMPTILLSKECKSATIHLFDESLQSAIALLEPIAQSFDVKLHVTPLVEGWLQIDIQSRKHGNTAQFITAAKQLLPLNIIAASNMATYIIERLHTHNKKISFAESCTGGLIAHFFTQASGASAVFDGSLVTYSNTLKENWLGVDKQNLIDFGAVSKEVVADMSEGVRNVTYADYAISVSGIAGPTGGTNEKPVGTVYIGVRSKDSANEEHLLFKGDRESVQQQSLFYAIKMLVLLDKKLFFEI